MAEVIPFPLIWRRAFIAKHAARVADLSPKAGEKHLAFTLRCQREAMLKKGINLDVIEHELATAEAAIHAAIWRIRLTGGAA